MLCLFEQIVVKISTNHYTVKVGCNEDLGLRLTNGIIITHLSIYSSLLNIL